MNTQAHAATELTRSRSTWDDASLQLTGNSDLVSVASTPNLLTDSDLPSVKCQEPPRPTLHHKTLVYRPLSLQRTFYTFPLILLRQ